MEGLYKICFILLIGLAQITYAGNPAKIQQWLNELNLHRQDNANAQIDLINRQLSNIPYKDSSVRDPRARAIYHSALDCQTFVETAMALFYSKNLTQYDNNLIKIAYGAAGTSEVNNFNRNHFIDLDWNPINRKNGWLKDQTSYGHLAKFAKKTSANLNRQNWFAYQHLNASDIFKTKTQKVSISYLPKEAFVVAQPGGGYEANKKLLDKIPTPAIMEVIRDTKKWTLNGKPIKEKLGTELNVSHLGLLYRKTFKKGELIYHRIYCYYDRRFHRKCNSMPVLCEKDQCPELMLSHATVSHPNGFFWYEKSKGKYVCTADLPRKTIKYTTCNRIEQIPVIDYLADYQYGYYWYLMDPSFLGVHIEALTSVMPAKAGIQS